MPGCMPPSAAQRAFQLSIPQLLFPSLLLVATCARRRSGLPPRAPPAARLSLGGGLQPAPPALAAWLHRRGASGEREQLPQHSTGGGRRASCEQDIPPPVRGSLTACPGEARCLGMRGRPVLSCPPSPSCFPSPAAKLSWPPPHPHSPRTYPPARPPTQHSDPAHPRANTRARAHPARPPPPPSSCRCSR